MKQILTFLMTACLSWVLGQSTIEKQLNTYRSQYLPEKVFVHTDKDVYAAGETLWMACYLVDGQTHKPGAFSTFIHLELKSRDQEVLIGEKIFTPAGRGSASFTLPADLAPGTYTLLAYTQYQRNSESPTLFTKPIQVVEGLQKTDSGLSSSTPPDSASYTSLQDDEIRLRFFPEGGDCISGLPCQMAVVAEHSDGSPLELKGLIQDAEQHTVSFFQSNDMGMAIVGFVPEPGKIYQATIGEQQVALPKSLDRGYSLSTLPQKDEIKLIIRTNLPQGLEGSKIVVHHRGLLFLEEKLAFQEVATVVPIRTADLAPGIYVATLFDPMDQPVAERLFFIAPDASSTELTISLDQARPRAGKDIQAILSLPNQDVYPDSLSQAHLSMSILPLVAHDSTYLSDIRTWLLLNSDLNLPIPAPAELLFEANASARDQRINQWLMTRGWRRFRWKALEKPDRTTLPFPLDRGLYIRGRMTQEEKPQKAQPGKVFLSMLEHNVFEDTLTDEEGNFEFGPYLLFDTTEVILQARFKLGKKTKKMTSIDLDDNPHALLTLHKEGNSPTIPLPPASREPLEIWETYQDLSRNMLAVSKNFDSLLIQLDEIQITAKRISEAEQKRKERAFLYNNPTRRMVVDSVPGARDVTLMSDLLLRVPGVTLVSGAIRLGGPTSFQAVQNPLLIVDDLPVQDLLNISVRDVEFIDILKGPDASIYGARGANGVILIYTRRGSGATNQRQPAGIKKFDFIGFHKAREFAVFDPEDPKNANRPDIRTTLHWNPSLKVDASKQVQESFRTSDQTGIYLIIAQGLRSNGIPLWGYTTFEVSR